MSIRADNCGGNQAGQTGSSSYMIQGMLCASNSHITTECIPLRAILFLSQANGSVVNFNGIPVFNVSSEFAVGIRFSWSPLVCHTHRCIHMNICAHTSTHTQTSIHPPTHLRAHKLLTHSSISTANAAHPRRADMWVFPKLHADHRRIPQYHAHHPGAVFISCVRL